MRADDHARLADGLEKVGAIAKARGLRAHYHPHLTTIVEGPAEVDIIFALTSIDFCPDTAHLAAAGGDVPAMIRKHGARISYVHLKGWRREPFAFTPLDEGDLDMAAIMQVARRSNLRLDHRRARLLARSERMARAKPRVSCAIDRRRLSTRGLIADLVADFGNVRPKRRAAGEVQCKMEEPYD